MKALYQDIISGKNHFGHACASQVMGSLENTGYPNGLPHWGTYLGGCQINDQTGFRFILLSWRCQLVLPN